MFDILKLLLAQHLGSTHDLNYINRLVSRWERLAFATRVVILAALAFGLWWVTVGHVFENTPVFGYIRGGTADWLVTREAWLGGDPYTPLDQLAEQRLGWQGMKPTDPHPRPPSALLLLGPLALSPSGAVIVMLAVAGALGLGFWTAASIKWMGYSPKVEVLVVVVALSAPGVFSVVWGSHIPIMAAFIGIGLLRESQVAYRAGGIAFASGYKLFPFLLAFAYQGGRVRTLVLTVSVFLGITVAGLILPGVDFGAAFSALVNAPGNYGTSDVSLSLNSVLGWGPGAVVFPLVGVAVVMVASRYLSQRGTVALSLIAMVILAPYAWPEYMLLWLPALLYTWSKGKSARLSVLIYLVVLALTRDGRILLAAGLILACTLVATEIVSRPRGQLAVPSRPNA